MNQGPSLFIDLLTETPLQTTYNKRHTQYLLMRTMRWLCGDGDSCDGGAQVGVFKLRKEVVWGWYPVKDKQAKDLAPVYCRHPESSLM